MISWTAMQSAITMGWLNAQEDRPYKASFWHLPKGYDVDNAKDFMVYFEDQESRDMFVRLHKDDESMACVEE